ncbi:excinuclease ABC subunit UvrC [Patescibacteria group bacterium]|nr:excinuclease ABC subunit UvrC [Patescibacteria group bacterium]
MIEEKKLKKILSDLPDSPGIYKMIDKEGIVIYVGKAKSLKKRVKQYFQKNYEHSTRTKKLLENIADLKFIEVDSELESLILETNTIKQLQPKYNVLMKDDKNYVYIKITKEDYPRIQIVREVKKDKANYYGPKTAGKKVTEILKVLKKIFPYRHCNLEIQETKNKVIVTHKTIKYPCLDYYIKRCCAPCINKCSKEEYNELIKHIENFLNGKAEDIVGNIKAQMMKLAKNRQFEKAANLRDRLQKIEKILERQKVSSPDTTDKDIINYLVTHQQAYFNLFQIRDGKLLGQENFILTAKEVEENSENNEVLEAFLHQYYEIAQDFPKEILIPHGFDNQKEFRELISQEAGKSIKITIPQKGDKNKLLDLSFKNAKIYADRHRPSWQEESELSQESLKELQKTLKLKEEPKRIECYDISHLSGTDTVGSMVVFEKGIPKKDHYRKFQLKTVVNKPDDYKSMEEVLIRRLQKIANEEKWKPYSLKKALKKHWEFIEKNTATKGLTYKDFYVLLKKDKPVGLIRITDHSKTVSEFNNLWISPKERGKKLGHKILKHALQKAASKRVYIRCHPELKDYYLMLGFEEIKQAPKELQSKNPLAMAYDKNKHRIDASFSSVPDLIVVDGGKGQLQIATKVLKGLGLKIPHISLAKQLEEIFTPNSKTSILLEKNNKALQLLQRARDEAHRFAISYNKKLRKKHFHQKLANTI